MAEPPDADVMHPVYLPVTKEQLRSHFATTSGGKVSDDRHLAYYVASLTRLQAFEQMRPLAPGKALKATKAGRQIEKDERFWVASALLSAYYPEDERRGRLSELLRRSIGDRPPFADEMTWDDALRGDLHLFFEVNAPSPKSYRKWLREQLDERVLVPYLREGAATRGDKLEGATKIDAVLLAEETGVAVYFEAKVLSDASPTTTFDTMRNQIARTIDVMLEENPNHAWPLNRRQPGRTCFVLLTPQVFQKFPHSRFYGHLMRDYRAEPKTLARDLPHRDPTDWPSVSSRLGWLTFEDCQELVPGSCRWLPPTDEAT